MTMISLCSANARVFLKNSRHCDNRNVYNYHKVIIIAFADEIIAFADNFNIFKCIALKYIRILVICIRKTKFFLTRLYNLKCVAL